MRIDVELRRQPDLEAVAAGHRLFLQRLWTWIRFDHTDEPHQAILDTGAPYSIIPRSLWRPLHAEPIATVGLRGIIPGATAYTRAILASVRAQILDTEHASPALTLGAMLARTDEIPLILGWSGGLDRARLVVDAPAASAWLEF